MSADVTQFNTKSDRSRWARAHADSPITWWTEEGPGGTIIIHETGRQQHLGEA